MATQYEISAHLAVKSDLADPNRIVLHNLYHQTELTVGPQVWDLLERHDQGAELDSSDLARQCVEARILVEAQTAEGPSSYLQDLRRNIDAYLTAQLKLSPERLAELFPQDASSDEGLREALKARVEMVCKACVGYLSLLDIDRENPEFEHWVWGRPEVLCAVIFDHLWILLEQDLGGPAAGNRSELARITLTRPPVDESYHQQPCTLATSLRRARRIRAALPRGGRALILGDDDLVSLALSLEGSPDLDVMELDDELLTFLRENVNARVIRQDLMEPLAEEYRGAYAVVSTDPPYTVDGMRAFLERSAEALAPGPESRLFVSTCPALLEDGQKLYTDLADLGLKVVAAERGFSRYPLPEIVAMVSLNVVSAYGLPTELLETVFAQPYLYADLLEIART